MVATCDWVDVGNGLKAYYGAPEGAGPHPCILVYIEAFGVNEHFKNLQRGWQTRVLQLLRLIFMVETPILTMIWMALLVN